MILKLTYSNGFDTRREVSGEAPLDEVVIAISTNGKCSRCNTSFEEIPEGEKFIFDNLIVGEDGTGKGDLICPRCADPHLEKETIDV